MTRSQRDQAGLTMIEVLAAMVIFSTAAVVLFGWIGQAADRMARLATEQRQLFAELAALEFARSLNPMQQPNGSQVVAGTEIKWKSRPLGLEYPVGSGTGGLVSGAAGAGSGAYAVQLFTVDMEAIATNGESSVRSVVLAGWRQTRAINDSVLFGVASGGSPPSVTPPTATP